MNPTSHGEYRRSSSQALGDMVDRLRRCFERTVYVDAAELPDDSSSPYRARITKLPEHGDAGFEVREREVVRGTVRVLYEIRCACGRRWFHRLRERIQLCPRCARAVLIESD